MRILRLYYLLPPKIGGMEKHIYHLTKIQNIDNDVKIIFNCGDPTSSNDTKVLSGIRLFKIKPRFIGIVIFYLAVIFNLLLDRQRYDIIHIHGDWSSLLFLRILKKLTRAKIIVFSIHGEITNSFVHQKILPPLLLKVNVIFSTGHETARRLKKLINKEVIVQPSGVNEIFFEPFEKYLLNEKFRVITVANLYPVKNIQLVLDIASKLMDMEFLIVGEGPEFNSLNQRIKSDNLHNVKLLGFKTSLEVKELFNTSDCYLLTSIAEGTPTSALEAMACGLPIISSNPGGINEIVKDYKNGFVIENYDAKSYCERIELISSDILLRENIFKNNIQLSKNYKWENVAGNISSIMESHLKNK